VYRVLKALQNTDFTVNRLSQEAQLSYSQAYNAFQDIMSDLQAMTDSTVPIADEVAFQKLGEAVTVDEYRFHLLKDSMAFNFFDYAFKADSPDVHEFCEQNDLSISTLRRRVEGFKVYLQSKGVTLNTSTWAPEGNELRIRMVLVNFFILAYRGVGWPFGDAHYHETVALAKQLHDCAPEAWFNRPEHDTKQDLLALGVQRLRLTQQHALPEIPRLLALTQAPDLADLPVVLRPAAPADPVMESAYFYFSRIHFLSLQGHMTWTDQWLIDHFQRRADAVAHFADGLLAYLVTQAPSNTPDADVNGHELLRANLYRMAYSF
jgi:hypothetical protein